MKRYLSIILSVICILSLVGCNTAIDKEPLDDTVNQVSYQVVKRYIEHNTGDINIHEYTYNEEGKLLSTKLYLNDTFQSSVEYNYDKDSNIVTITNTSSNSEITVTDVQQEFNSAGQLIKESSYSDGTFAGSTEYFYDDEGRQTKMVTKHANSDRVITVFYEYDKSGNQILYGIDTGFYISKKEHFYNEENKIYRTDDYRNDELINRTEYHWEENTRYGEVYDGKEQLIAKNVYIFDDFGNSLVEETYDSMNVLDTRICYEYMGTDGSISSGIPNEK
jgi:YD repeat-containing protein